MQKIKPGIEYVAFGKPTRYGSKMNIAHPEIEPVTENNLKGNSFSPSTPSQKNFGALH